MGFKERRIISAESCATGENQPHPRPIASSLYPQTATLLQQVSQTAPNFPLRIALIGPLPVHPQRVAHCTLNGPLLGQSRNPSLALSLCVKLRGVQLLRRQLAPFDIHVPVSSAFLMDGALFEMSDPPPLP